MEKAATRTITFTENDVALPAERGNLEYAGLALVYEGNRVKSALLGRDLNPLGRGDGAFYFSGAVKFSAVDAGSLRSWNVMVGTGNSVNNPSQTGGGYTPIGPPSDGSSSSPFLELTSDWEKRTGKKPANSSIWDSPPGGGLPHLIIGATCCGTLSACCMTMNAAGEYVPYSRCFIGPTAPCDDPSACGAPPVTPGNRGGGGGTSGGSGGCCGGGGGAGGGPMSSQDGGGGGGQISWPGGGSQGMPGGSSPGGGTFLQRWLDCAGRAAALGFPPGWQEDCEPPLYAGLPPDIIARHYLCIAKVQAGMTEAKQLLDELYQTGCCDKDLLNCMRRLLERPCWVCLIWFPGEAWWTGIGNCVVFDESTMINDNPPEIGRTILHELGHGCGEGHIPNEKRYWYWPWGWYSPQSEVDKCIGALEDVRNARKKAGKR